jgi:hypothetical protein
MFNFYPSATATFDSAAVAFVQATALEKFANG